MNTNKDYWKDAYQDFWDVASAKEKSVKQLIEKQTNFEVIIDGLGAGSTEYISGSAEDHGSVKGDADLYIPEKDCYIEVTGPMIAMSYDKPLWIRPDKIQNTWNKIQAKKGKLHVVFHILKEKGTNKTIIRVIKLDSLFFQHYITRKTFHEVNPIIRGRHEKYIEIPHEHEVIITLDDFFILLKSI